MNCIQNGGYNPNENRNKCIIHIGWGSSGFYIQDHREEEMVLSLVEKKKVEAISEDVRLQ